MMAKRQFTEVEEALMRLAHAGKMPMRHVAARLRTSYQAIYREFAAMGLPQRKPDRRSAKPEPRT